MDGQENEDSVTSETLFNNMFVAQLLNSMYDVQNRMGWQSCVSLPRWGFYRCEKRRRVSSIQEFIQVKIGETKNCTYTPSGWDENGIVRVKRETNAHETTVRKDGGF